MISELRISNFQTHRKQRLVLDQITTITGPNDVGKSAILRSLYWLFFNRPLGTDIIRDGALTAKVQAKVDGVVVGRERGEENKYIFKGEPLFAFNQDVPDLVAQHLNVSILNFQRQHEAAFWLSLKPLQVARELNQIVNLEEIDVGLAKVATMQREAKATAKVAGQHLKEIKAELEDKKRYLVLDQKLRVVEALDQKAYDLGTRRSLLVDLAANLSHYQKAAEQLAQCESRAQNCVSLGQAARDLGARTARLSFLLTRGRKLRRQAKQVVDFKKVEQTYLTAATAQARRNRLQTLLDQTTTNTGLLAKLKKRAEAAERKLHQELKGTCPLCGQSLPS